MMTAHGTASEMRAQEDRNAFPGKFGFVVACGILLGAVFAENGAVVDRCVGIAVALVAIALYIWNKPHEVVISADASCIRISRKVIGSWRCAGKSALQRAMSSILNKRSREILSV